MKKAAPGTKKSKNKTRAARRKEKAETLPLG